MKTKDGGKIEIRTIEREDAAALLRFFAATVRECDTLASGPEDFELTVEQEQAYLDGVARQPHSMLLGAWMGGEIVGVAGLSTPAKKRVEHTSELSVAVRKACWNKGVGSALLDALLAFARETRAIRLVHLGVRADYVAAIALYRKFGFVEAGRFPGFLHVNGRYYDELLMILDLTCTAL